MRKIPYGQTAATVALCAALAPVAAYATELEQTESAESDIAPMEQPTPKSHPQPSKTQESEVDNLNYFINLAGDVLDSEAGAGHHASSDFTDALTPEYKVDGDVLEEATNASSMENDIQEKSGNTTWIYDAVMGENPDDYVAADAEIRKILSAKGLLPNDEAVLAEAKRQIESGTTIKDINGETISSSLISTAYYKVYWYVLKEGGDYWHVDGIMKKLEQPKVQTYTVEYQWTNAPESQTLPRTVTYAENDLVTVDTTYTANMEIAVDGGKWIFSGWNKSGAFNITSNTVISGSWEFVEDEIEKVTLSYEWAGEHPSEAKAPGSVEVEKGQTVTIDTFWNGVVFTDVNGVKWAFKGWDKSGSFALTANTIVYGTWERVTEEKPIVKVWLMYEWNGEAPDTAVRPAPEQYGMGETVKITDAYSVQKDLVDSKGVKWTFKGWDRTGEFQINGDTMVYGSWERVVEEVPPAIDHQEFDVIYEWGGDVPDDAVLPGKNTYEKDTVVSVDKTYNKNTVIETENGKYYFSGWDVDDEFAVDKNTVIRGTWTFVENEKVIPPTDEEIVPPAKETTPPVENAVVKPAIPQTGDSSLPFLASLGAMIAALGTAIGIRFKQHLHN